jgi:hypothetical protein
MNMNALANLEYLLEINRKEAILSQRRDYALLEDAFWDEPMEPIASYLSEGLIGGAGI